MSWNLIRSLQQDTDLRLILPFGLSVRLGDIVSVDRNGNLTLQGRCESHLRLEAGSPRVGQPIDLMHQSGDGTSITYRGEGTASSLFPQLPSASAGFDVSFGSQNSYLLALKGRVLATLTDLDRFRQPILRAYRCGVWQPDWVLVTAVSTVERMTLLASQTRDTKLALSLDGQVAENAALEAKLTGGVSILSTSHNVTSCITTEPAPAFCEGWRIKASWWKPTDVGTLSISAVNEEAEAASPDDFWEKMDDVAPYK